jgi:hypothetical protein
MSGVITEWKPGSFLNWTNPMGPNSNPLVSDVKKNYSNRGLFFSMGQPGMNPEKIKNVSDGTSKTVMLGEFHWLGMSEPAWPAMWAVTQRWSNKAGALADPLLRSTDVDFCYDNMTTAPLWACPQAFGWTHAGNGGNWLKIDGSVDFITWFLDGSVYEAMATIAGDDEFAPR